MPSEGLRFSDIRRISTFRITVSLGVAFVVGVVILLAVIYVLTTRELTARSDRILSDEAQRLLAVPANSLPSAIEARLNTVSKGLDYVELISQSGERVVGNIIFPPRAAIGKAIDVNEQPGGAPIRMLATRTPDGEVVVVGRDISQIRDLSQYILITLLVTGVLIALAIGVTGVLFSIEPLRRVRLLQQRSSQIASGRLDLRMPISQRQDELDQFAATVNVMIEEVERVVSQVKGVTDAVAHDLRTPLNRVRAKLHRWQHLPGAPSQVTALADEAVNDLDIVLERFSALLRISELEADVRHSGFARVNLPELIHRAAELYEPLGEERGVILQLHAVEPVFVRADDKLLFEAVSNLLDNAVKFSPEHSAIEIRVARAEAEALLEIKDQGPGIPESERQAVLRRFHRGSDAQHLPGSGLGLSIVNAIVHMHGYRMELLNAGSGLLVRVRMPLLN